MHWRDVVVETQRIAARSRLGRRAALKLRNYCQGVVRFHLEIPWSLEESGEMRLLNALGSSVRRFVDVGANVGDWASGVLAASPEADGVLVEA